MPNAMFDLAELLARVENGRELMRDLLLIFKQEFPRHLQALRDAVASMNGGRVAAGAHSLKGMLSNLAAGPAVGGAAPPREVAPKREEARFRGACGSLGDNTKGLPVRF